MLRFVTLDGFNIFAVPFKTFDELEELSAIYGKPWFVPRLTPRTVTKLQKAALMKFIKNPEMSSTDLAEELSLPRTAARKLMAWVKKNVNYTYRVNLGRAGIVALAVRSQAPLGLYAPYKFFKCFAYAIGFYGVAFPERRHRGGVREEDKGGGPRHRGESNSGLRAVASAYLNTDFSPMCGGLHSGVCRIRRGGVGRFVKKPGG